MVVLHIGFLEDQLLRWFRLIDILIVLLMAFFRTLKDGLLSWLALMDILFVLHMPFFRTLKEGLLRWLPPIDILVCTSDAIFQVFGGWATEVAPSN